MGMRKPRQIRAQDQTLVRGNNGDVFIWVRMGSRGKNKAWLQPDTRRPAQVVVYLCCASSRWRRDRGSSGEEAFHGQRKDDLVNFMNTCGRWSIYEYCPEWPLATRKQITLLEYNITLDLQSQSGS